MRPYRTQVKLDSAKGASHDPSARPYNIWPHTPTTTQPSTHACAASRSESSVIHLQDMPEVLVDFQSEPHTRPRASTHHTPVSAYLVM
jgi:hypothetical protein